MASAEQTRIKNAFLNGMELVFFKLFSDRVLLYPLDLDNTVVDSVYGETPEKKYKEPYQLIAQVILHEAKAEMPEGEVTITATIKVPTKQLIKYDIPRLTEQDLDMLREWKFQYNGEDYLIVIALPQTMVADEWQFYKFECEKDRKNAFPR